MSSPEKASDIALSLPVDDFDTPEDRALLRKVDLRTNIGNAKLDGLATDLHVSAPAYNTALALYFIGYVIFEVPSNIMFPRLKRFDPQFWLPSLTLVWGIVSVCQGLVTNQAGLFGIRFWLFPGVVFLFSVYYRRRERGWRVAIFFGGAALAGAFGGKGSSASAKSIVAYHSAGILAYAIGKMDGIGGRRGWQWIFILEGLLTIVISLGAYFVVPTWLHSAKFLTEWERERLIARLNADSDAGNEEIFQWVFVRRAWTDHLVWAYALLFHGFAFVLYSLSLFMPTIIAGLGFATWKAQLMTVPPNTIAALSIWGTVWLSSKFKVKAPFIIGAAFVAILGYIVLITAPTEGGQYVGVLLAAAGIYTGNALLLSWPGENVSGQTKRAVAVAMQITIGDIGAIAGSLVYRPELSKHRYRKPHIIAIGYLLFAIVVATYLWINMAYENKRRDRILSENGNEEGSSVNATKEGDVNLGDRDVHYRYVI
ncbi:MFS general substrate transporter [Athelia psychrophila]|uniref:MFS general substrate transporter n=1 Tax=Athelia psychrophila TaxID=1759441 RepID=A0A166W9W8_9AGAM|nr:MFS general substrate transporter [Fibularhizoctonia sp. CBS 109695]